MPPKSDEVAARALEAAQAAVHAAEIARMTADAATKAAETAKMVSESMVREMRERFDRQDTTSKEFRDGLMKEIQGQNRTFDQFKTDFEKEIDKQDRRCAGHHDTLYGNPERNIRGVVPTAFRNENQINKVVWSWGLVCVMFTGFIAYIVFFYGDSMKRGIFNPSDEEWRWRVNREIKRTIKPDAVKPLDQIPN